MTRSLHEIRPGRYVWMEDGQVIGPATDEEADAWIGMTLYPDPVPDVGLLWYDASNKPLTDKVAPAIARFEAKFGRKASVVYVYPADVPTKQSLKVRMEADIYVPKHHMRIE